MKQLAGFSAKDKRTAARIWRVLDGHGLTLADLERHNEQAATHPAPGTTKPVNRPQPPPYMRPGEIATAIGLKCVCGGTFYIEALCSKNAAKLNCIRLALCDSCGFEVKIR
jgi:hypothetical protein